MLKWKQTYHSKNAEWDKSIKDPSRKQQQCWMGQIDHGSQRETPDSVFPKRDFDYPSNRNSILYRSWTETLQTANEIYMRWSIHTRRQAPIIARRFAPLHCNHPTIDVCNIDKRELTLLWRTGKGGELFLSSVHSLTSSHSTTMAGFNICIHALAKKTTLQTPRRILISIFYFQIKTR